MFIHLFHSYPRKACICPKSSPRCCSQWILREEKECHFMNSSQNIIQRSRRCCSFTYQQRRRRATWTRRHSVERLPSQAATFSQMNFKLCNSQNSVSFALSTNFCPDIAIIALPPVEARYFVMTFANVIITGNSLNVAIGICIAWRSEKLPEQIF